jgi:hypothetical protein
VLKPLGFLKTAPARKWMATMMVFRANNSGAATKENEGKGIA